MAEFGAFISEAGGTKNKVSLELELVLRGLQPRGEILIAEWGRRTNTCGSKDYAVTVPEKCTFPAFGTVEAPSHDHNPSSRPVS